jgi:xanthine dehydrogenase molybdopterin binding subunit/xanthine dehydrogenase small subunit
LVDRDAVGNPTYRTMTSCIALLPALAGREVITVEGLQAGMGALHPVQSAMVAHFGSQCGYCTPGFVMSLFEAYYRSDCRTSSELSDQLSGNLCRCTGYRPIRDAALTALATRVRGGDAFKERLKAPAPTLKALDYSTESGRLIRPDSLKGLLEALNEHDDARLVAGATELGVEATKKRAAFSLLVSTEGIPELRRINRGESVWNIGASATLTEISEALGAEFPSLAKMLRVFASRQIRNRATLGGNLATASPIGDSAPVLMSLDASLVLASVEGLRKVALSDFFVAYRKTALRRGEIIFSVEIPHFKGGEGLERKSEFMKVSKRRELDISIVAAAFSLDLDATGVVRRARIAYGGVAAMPVRARKAEAALVGKTIQDAAESAAAMLGTEFSPIDDVRAGAEFRRGLVVSLWEKFVSGETSVAQDGTSEFEMGRSILAEDRSRGLRHESAVGHVNGGAHYVGDTAQQRPMLEIWPVCSSHACARIVRRDFTAALAVPGVECVLAAEDIPGRWMIGPGRDEPLFARDEVSYHSQIIAVVVGRTLRSCREAAAAVVIEYEPIAPILGIKNAINGKSFHAPPLSLARGDVTAALERARNRLDGELLFGGQEHFYLETQAAWAEVGESGSILVGSSTQDPSGVQSTVADVLGIQRSNVVVQTPRIGGGFGGKETQATTFAAIAALAAMRTRKPVRLQLDRDVDMAVTGKRHPFLARYSVGFDDDGHLLAAEVELFSDGGWSVDLSQEVLGTALIHLDNSYYIPTVKFTGLSARTNVASNTAFRGFGAPQGMLVIEEIMDRVSRALGLPPETVRGRNLYHGSGETNTTHYQQEIGDNRIQAAWSQVQLEAAFAERRRSIDDWNRTHPRIKRGLAITPVKMGVAHKNQAGALVLLYSDGSAQVNHGGTEMGQGLHTKMRGIVIRELGLSEERVRMMQTSTDKVPNTWATAGSSSADINGEAVRKACAILRERILPVAAKLLSKESLTPISTDRIDLAADRAVVRGTSMAVTMSDICKRAHEERISLSATGFHTANDFRLDWAESRGSPFQYFACGAAVAEVEVDGYTGMHRVLRVDAVHDVGNSLNPGIDLGQIEGGLVQGIGWLTREELLWDSKGRLLTHSASTYQIPAISDAPVEFRVTLLPRAGQPGTINGSKGVGEPPLMLALSVREAIRDAVSAFGPKACRIDLPSPSTCEAIFAAIRARMPSRSAGLPT